MQITIANEADLKSVATILHDARFTGDAIDCDAAAHTFTLKCWVQGLKPKNDSSVLAELKRREEIGLAAEPQKFGCLKMFPLFFFRASSAIWRRFTKGNPAADSRIWQACRLSFANVVDCKVNAKEKVRYYELATIRFSECDRKLDLVTHYAIEISLVVGELDGTLTETSETRDKWDAPVKHLSTA
jgi:hypothetical protein